MEAANLSVLRDLVGSAWLGRKTGEALTRNCTGGASGYIDRLFFTEAHIIPKPRCARIYHSTLSVDPEGILGTFNSIALCVFGLQAGKILHLHSTVRGRMVRLLLWGSLLISCSAVLSKCHMADGWIPINKTLW
eukprot:XP_011667236.1 PREDICTED: heparan-alpha-glucosaminide N-acetyltransferase-like [Strongylocentrotus purpuratus]